MGGLKKFPGREEFWVDTEVKETTPMSEPITEDSYLDPTFRIASPIFAAESMIPASYTVEGAGMSPPLAWYAVPEGTKSFALVVFDPDTVHGDFTHWVLYDLPAYLLGLDAGVDSALPAGALRGTNGKGELGWTPPAPPPGDKVHRYIFQIYALDRPTLSLPEGATRDQIEDAAQAYTLSIAAFEGRFRRP